MWHLFIFDEFFMQIIVSCNVCNQYPGYLIWTNYEVLGFQPQSDITTALYCVAYCYVPIPRLSWYSSPRLSHRTGSSAHLGVARICPIIFSHLTRSSTHPGIARRNPRISDYPLDCPVSCYYIHDVFGYLVLHKFKNRFQISKFQIIKIQCLPKIYLTQF